MRPPPLKAGRCCRRSPFPMSTYWRVASIIGYPFLGRRRPASRHWLPRRVMTTWHIPSRQPWVTAMRLQTPYPMNGNWITHPGSNFSGRGAHLVEAADRKSPCAAHHPPRSFCAVPQERPLESPPQGMQSDCPGAHAPGYRKGTLWATPALALPARAGVRQLQVWSHNDSSLARATISKTRNGGNKNRAATGFALQ